MRQLQQLQSAQSIGNPISALFYTLWLVTMVSAQCALRIVYDLSSFVFFGVRYAIRKIRHAKLKRTARNAYRKTDGRHSETGGLAGYATRP